MPRVYVSCAFVVGAMIVGISSPGVSQIPPVPSGSIAAPSPQPTPSPTPKPRLRDIADSPIFLSAGVTGVAASQGDAAKQLLAALKAQLAWVVLNDHRRRLLFDDLTPSNACADDQKDKGILELTYGRIVSVDDNFFIAEHFSQRVEIAAVLRSCTGKLLAEDPQRDDVKRYLGAENGAWIVYKSSDTSLALLGIVGIASIVNAKNTDKTAAAAVTFLGNVKDVRLPQYHKDDKAALEITIATIDVASYLHDSMSRDDRAALFGTDVLNLRR
jgi:hypothetical protein